MCAVCEFRIEFGIGHPMALTVAVATRKAIDAGLVDAIDETDKGPLAAARRRGEAIDALNLLQDRIEAGHAADDLLALPDFYVLLIENDTWGFFHATTEGFDPDIVPEMPDIATDDESKRSNVVITSEAALRSWLASHFDTCHAFDETLFVVDAPEAFAASRTRMLVRAESVITVE